MLFIDFSSAFNTIQHPSKLITKLHDFGIDPSLCNWVLDFLTNRPQSVRLDNHTSSTLTLNTGVPQGCVLSPLLYSLFTYDCRPVHGTNTIIKFADDTAVIGFISNNDESAYREEVQHLSAWKSKAGTHSPIRINGTEVECVATFKFLGVHISEDLSWSLNTSSLVKKAHQRLFFLRRLKKVHLSRQILENFYRCTIHPWSCYMKENGTEYDYSAYYADDFDASPCNSSKVRDFGSVFLPTFYSLVFIIGFIGNGLVVCVLVKHRNQTNLTDICLFNLALSDLFFILSLPFFAHNAATTQWVFGDFMCRFTSGLHTLGFFGSIFFMVAMTIDRYVVIVHPHMVARHRTLRTGIILSMLVWMLSFCTTLPSLLFTQVTNESSVLRCSSDIFWKDFDNFTMHIFGLLIPLFVMIFCYSRVIPTLVRMRSAKKHRVIKLIIIIVAVFFFFWGPYNICLFLRYLQFQGQLENDCEGDSHMNISIQVTEIIAYSHCCLNPIIYAFAGEKFKHRVLKLMRKWVPWCFPLSLSDTSESTFRRSSVTSRTSEAVIM
ncbi:C-C chemokine receptor type 5-like [Diretmus argenteus]